MGPPFEVDQFYEFDGTPITSVTLYRLAYSLPADGIASILRPR